MPEGSDSLPRLYGDLAHLWPLMSPPEDYAVEASHWRGALRRVLGPGRHHILDLGCGGGHNLSHLTSDFDATAVDLSEQMLAHSRRLNPGVTHHQGDMRTVRLGRTFDAVLIHDAIDYMLTEGDLRATFATASAHLREGGVLIAAPDHYRETFEPPVVDERTSTRDGMRLTYVEVSTDPDPSDTRIETVYVFLVEESGSLAVHVDRHVTGIFPLAIWERLLSEAGFAPERVDYPVAEDGRPMYLWVGVKTSVVFSETHLAAGRQRY